VKVHICGSKNQQRRLSFDGMVVMVCVDEQGRPVEVRNDKE
jgi:hypothetical protein